MPIRANRCAPLVALASLVPVLAHASNGLATCERLLKSYGAQLADATCVASADLTTTNPDTTPANNSIAGLPALAFTPQTDRATIAPCV